MNKIGIIVSRVSSGAEILFSSEAAKQWQNEALDTRNYLKCIDIEKISEDKFDSTFFDFVTFGKDVAFICTNKYISGRDFCHDCRPWFCGYKWKGIGGYFTQNKGYSSRNKTR